MARRKKMRCPACDRDVAAIHDGGPRFGTLALLLSILTLGVWFVAWLAYATAAWLTTYRRSNWLCPICGLHI